MRPRLNVVVAGDVDCGKSTVVGRLLLDSGSLARGRLDRARDECAKAARPFEYAYLVDALRQEQMSNMTLDVSRSFLRGVRRDYWLLDAPGHAELLRNMATGAAHASAALWVVSARDGLSENSRRHGRLLSILGIAQVAILVNKMDAVGYDQAAFRRAAYECGGFLRELGVARSKAVPMAAFEGENVVRPGSCMPWHRGPTVLAAVEGFAAAPAESRGPFRMPVQDVYAISSEGQRRQRRVVVGSIESGTVSRGDEIIFYPSRRRAVVRSIETFPRRALRRAEAGMAIALALDRRLEVGRGEMAALLHQAPPNSARRILASLLWLGPSDFERGRRYMLRLGAAGIPARLDKVIKAVETATLKDERGASRVRPNEAAECVLSLGRPLACDVAEENPLTGRFVIVNEHRIVGGGFVRQVLR